MNADPRLAKYVTNTDRDVFALQNLPEEVAAVLFAFYSRSKDGLRENLLKLLDEGDLAMAEPGGRDQPLLADAQAKAHAFHEKWVVGYGHSSVAEHAVVKLGIENVSILASKLIEDGRLASYTEKSTRYVQFDPSKAHYPEAILASPLAGLYQETITSLMNAYTGWMEEFVAQIKQRVPKTEKQTERGYENACRSTACDLLRYLLPAATHTNIGLTINARSLETLITKLLSQPLPEGQKLGAQIKAESVQIVPTLLKYADASPYRAQWSEVVPSPASCPCASDEFMSGARIVGPHPTEDEALTLLALPHSPETLNLDDLFSERGKHDAVPRAFERVTLTFDLMMDYGAYRDVQRHRLATQITEPLSPIYGYEILPEIRRFGYEESYRELMKQSSTAFVALADAGFAREASYVLPLAYRVRTLFTANLRELFHFIELRSGRGGHPSYRKIARQVFGEVEGVYPKIARFIRVNKNEYALTRE